MANPNACPHCGGVNGFHTKSLVDFKSIHDWNGEHVESYHTRTVRGSTRFYCCDCGRDITRHIESPKLNEKGA